MCVCVGSGGGEGGVVGLVALISKVGGISADILVLGG